MRSKESRRRLFLRWWKVRGEEAYTSPQDSSSAYRSRYATISPVIIIALTIMTTPRGVQSRCKRMGLPPFLFYLVLSIHEAPDFRPRLETAALYGSRNLARLHALTPDHEVNFVRRP